MFNITDSALEFLIKFLAVFFEVFTTECDRPSNTSDVLPKTLYSFRKFLSIDKKYFTKYVACLKCNNLYNIDSCLIRHGGETKSKDCEHVKYPNHPQRQHRKKCGQPLMKCIKSVSGKETFYPYKTYCYRSIKQSLKVLLERPQFENDCEKWRDCYQEDNVLGDIYDGKIWKNFSNGSNQLFFAEQRNFGVMLNVDWFQPFKHLSSFSIGGIYLVLLNLPYFMRFKRKNVILIGIIPDMPKEPPTNTFLKPLVEELEEAWDEGFLLNSLLTKKEELFHIALLCVGCDIPASRKLCGFLGLIEFIYNIFHMYF